MLKISFAGALFYMAAVRLWKTAKER